MFDKMKLLSDEELERYKSDYFNIRINLKGLYGWGVGYYHDKQFDTYDFFNNTLQDALEKVGFEIETAQSETSCNRLRQENTRLDLYLHPMEFTGSATLEQADKILEVIKEYSDYVKAEMGKAERLYDIPDRTYRYMIYSRAGEIAKEILSDPSSAYDADMKFAEKCRIDRVQKYSTGGICSLDTDVSSVKDIADRIKQLKEENIPASFIPEIVSGEATMWCRQRDENLSLISAAVLSMSDDEFRCFMDSCGFLYSNKVIFLDAVSNYNCRRMKEFVSELDSQHYIVFLNVKGTIEDLLPKSMADKSDEEIMRYCLDRLSSSEDRGRQPYGKLENVEIKGFTKDNSDKDFLVVKLAVTAKMTDRNVFSQSVKNVAADTIKQCPKGRVYNIEAVNAKIRKVGLPLLKQAENYHRKPYYINIEKAEDGTYTADDIKGITLDMRDKPEIVCTIDENDNFVVSDKGMVVVKNPLYNMSLAQIDWTIKEQEDISRLGEKIQGRDNDLQKG